MKFNWRKLGQLYVPTNTGRHPKLLSHAANPVAIQLDGDIFRVYYSGRDYKNRSSVGAVDIDLSKLQIIKDHPTPFFEHGPENSFYADGVSIGCHYTIEDRKYILFMGWQSPSNEHWRGDIGRLIINHDMSLQLDSDTPLISCTSNDIDTLSLSYPWVIKNENECYDMWYGSTQTWDTGNGEMLHVINSAHSLDGNTWERCGLAVPFGLGVAQAFSRPTVVKNTLGDLEMWFSYRSGNGESYRIGYAVSDGKKWQLAIENSGIDISPQGWDSEMIEYPFVFDHNGQRYMLYNGNGYGKTGFGIAILER